MKSFSHTRPLRDDSGAIVAQVRSPARRVTVEKLGPAFGADSKRRLVVSLEAGDVVTFRPHTTRHEVSAPAAELYRAVLLWRVNAANLARARERKAAKVAQREARAMRAAEHRLVKGAR